MRVVWPEASAPLGAFACKEQACYHYQAKEKLQGRQTGVNKPETTARGNFIWPNISTNATSFLQSNGYNKKNNGSKKIVRAVMFLIFGTVILSPGPKKTSRTTRGILH